MKSGQVLQGFVLKYLRTEVFPVTIWVFLLANISSPMKTHLSSFTFQLPPLTFTSHISHPQLRTKVQASTKTQPSNVNHLSVHYNRGQETWHSLHRGGRALTPGGKVPVGFVRMAGAELRAVLDERPVDDDSLWVIGPASEDVPKPGMHFKVKEEPSLESPSTSSSH
ncbi:hypothetical protein RRF57_010110 [Xylaria bambusicola]|uniref:Uncharacterized protein n=1 Tax=Xylaria bambusicola TaxID=326684 RepID=A0AAN7UWR5_9PEZI